MTLAAGLAALAGCGADLGTFVPADGSDGNQDAMLTSPLGKTAGEPNDDFPSAIAAVFDATGIARLKGTVSQRSDLDVFLLGELMPGDEIVVDAATAGSSLDVSVALFDGFERLTFANDDRGGDALRFLDSHLDWVVRHASPRYYLVVTDSAFASVGQDSGGYSVDVRVTPNQPVPPPVGQVLLLDFDGGSVDSPALGTMTLAPFDAADISRVYAGQTEFLKSAIRAAMEADYAAFDVTIVTSDDPLPPGSDGVSTVHFGGLGTGVFGISEQVDLYNLDFCDDAIIFTESFRPRIFFRTPSPDELAIAIANVGSHESGHLLGLNHVQDDRALMDDQSVPDALLEDQSFLNAPLSPDIMPIGTQDAVLLLEEIVGPSRQIGG